MQIQRGEEGQLFFRSAGCQLGFCPVEISLDFLFQFLQHGQVFLMDAVLRQFGVVTGYELVVQIIRFIKGLFAPGRT